MPGAATVGEDVVSQEGVIGVSDHGGWAVLVTATADGKLVDRRRVELVDEGLPKIPHHSEAQRLPMAEAVELVERVRGSAERHARSVLGTISRELPVRIVGVALRQCPELPGTVAECITNYRAQNVADWVMYRKALAAAAKAQGWRVHWFDPRRVQGIASKTMRIENLDEHFANLRRSIGPPWGQDHKMAMAAAISAMTARDKGRATAE